MKKIVNLVEIPKFGWHFEIWLKFWKWQAHWVPSGYPSSSSSLVPILHLPLHHLHAKHSRQKIMYFILEATSTTTMFMFMFRFMFIFHLHHSRLIRKGVNQFTCNLKRCDPITPYLKRCEHIHTLSKKVWFTTSHLL